MANGDYIPDVPQQEQPPNFREADSESDERCGNCQHFLDFRCEKYDDYPILDITVCDSFESAV
jgi:hypothetical protein